MTIRPLLTLLLAQVSGEAAVRALGLPVPGPVAGMAILLVLLAVRPATGAEFKPVAGAILGMLGLLFVPAGVGVVGHLGRIGPDAPALALALVASTAAAIAVGALVFAALARAMGRHDG